MLCLLCPTPDDQRPRNGGSDFEALFGDVVRGPEPLWWAITGGSYSPWSLPPAWYGDDAAEDAFYGQFNNTLDGKHAVASGRVFRDAMKYLTDFWLEVYAFPHKPEAIDIESWWAGDGLPIPAGVPCGAKHAFVNVDGSYWAALSNDETLLRGFANKWPLARFVPVAGGKRGSGAESLRFGSCPPFLPAAEMRVSGRMTEPANQPKREPLTVGDVFLMPLANRMLSACRVLYKIDQAQHGLTGEAWMVVGCDWTGVEPPPLGHPSVRRPLRLTHHYHEATGKQFSQAWLAGPVPDGFLLLGNLTATPEETPPLFPHYGTWEALRANALDQWRWDHEREAVLAEDAVKAAELKVRQAEFERQRRAALRNMTYAQFRGQRLFPDWGEPTPRKMIAASRKLMKETATRLEALGHEPDREAARAVLRDCILAFNRLDEENGHWIETVEREDICLHFSALAHIAGFGDEPELADEWRDW